MSVALLQEVRFAISFKKQTALQTALTAADCWSLRHTNTDLLNATHINEDDANDLGKGVYITQQFQSHMEAGGPWNGRLTSEAAAMLATFGVGKTVKTAAGTGFKYTCATPNLASDGLDMPAATGVVAIRQGGGAITDKALIGLCCEEFGFSFGSGPGRDNALFTSQWIGSGKYVKPSGITIPAITSEHNLNAGGAITITILGFNYLTNLRFISTEFRWKNNIRDNSSFFPGSGAQGSTQFQLRGRMRRGTPQINLSFRCEADSGSSEEDTLIAGTEGTAVIQVDGAVIGAGPEKHSLKITLHRIKFNVTRLAENEGIASYDVECTVMEHSTNGVSTIEVVNEKDNILA